MNAKPDLATAYRRRHSTILMPLAQRLESHMREILQDQPRIDSVVVRAKTPASFLKKAAKIEEGKEKYSDPLNQIQDQVGARIVTFFLSDVDPLAHLILDHFGAIEEQNIVPDSAAKFGYEAKHFILLLPKDVLTPDVPRAEYPNFFELQISTLFQHAWAQANHDLGYKPPEDLSWEQARRIAFTSAQAWGADVIFNGLAAELTGSQSPRQQDVET